MYEELKAKMEAAKPQMAMLPTPTPFCQAGAGYARKMGTLLGMYGIGKALVITDQSLHRLGILDGMLESLKKAGISYVIFDGVTPDPTYAVAEQAIAVCREYGCDGIVAVGGGSVLDTAKVASVCVSSGQHPWELPGRMKVKSLGLPWIAVPTTAGTGSETTIVAVISHPETHQKYTICDPKLIPDCAVLDPELTMGLPVTITAFTAMDALTHALEAYVSGFATPATDRLARTAIRLIYGNLEKVCGKPDDLPGREALLTASFYGGMAFTRTFVGYVHAFAHNIGGKFGIPHGLANAVLLPHVMQFCLPECEERFAELAVLTGQSGKDAGELAQAFVDSIFALNRRLAIPERLEKFPAEAVEAMVKAAFAEAHGTYAVPHYMTPEEGAELLRKVCAE